MSWTLHAWLVLLFSRAPAEHPGLMGGRVTRRSGSLQMGPFSYEFPSLNSKKDKKRRTRDQPCQGKTGIEIFQKAPRTALEAGLGGQWPNQGRAAQEGWWLKEGCTLDRRVCTLHVPWHSMSGYSISPPPWHPSSRHLWSRFNDEDRRRIDQKGVQSLSPFPSVARLTRAPSFPSTALLSRGLHSARQCHHLIGRPINSSPVGRTKPFAPQASFMTAKAVIPLVVPASG